MTPGVSHQGVCFSSAALAADAACTGSYPVTGVDASGPYSLSCQGTDAGGLLLLRSRPGGPSEAFTLGLSFPPCDMDAVSNGIPTPGQAGAAFAWGFGGVLLVYCVAWGCGRILAAIGH